MNDRLSAAHATRRKNLTEKYEKATRSALDYFHRNKTDRLFITGIALYWGEGDKKNKYQVRISNTDPDMSRVFTLFLKKHAQIPLEKIWASLILYPDIDVGRALDFWSQKTGVPLGAFQKSTIIVGKGKRRSDHGVCIVGTSSAELKIKMRAWIAELEKSL